MQRAFAAALAEPEVGARPLAQHEGEVLGGEGRPRRLRRLQPGSLGSLQKGKDADFVVFSGSPFEPSSRVLLVVVDGEVVVDRRAEVRK